MAEIREAGRSGTRTNWTFSFAREIGNTDVYVSYILNENYACEPEEPNQAGTFIEQLTADGLPRGADGAKVPHPTIPNVYVGFDNYALSEGRVRLSAEWSEGDITSDQADAYVTWLQTENFGLDIENIQQEILAGILAERITAQLIRLSLRECSRQMRQCFIRGCSLPMTC